jgi:hypothetical protein
VQRTWFLLAETSSLDEGAQPGDIVPSMQPKLSAFRRTLLGLAVVGVAAVLVYVFCRIIVLQLGFSTPDADSGRIFAQEITGRGGRVWVLYVTHALHLTFVVSGSIAAALWGAAAVALLATTIGQTLRLLIPGRVAFANIELARYRRRVADVTAEGLRYVEAWRDLKLRRHLFTAVSIGGVALLIAYALAFPGSRDWSVAGAFLAWLALSVVTVTWMRGFKCPRCSEPFSDTARNAILLFCTNCGLAANSPPTDDVSPAFVEWKKPH